MHIYMIDRNIVSKICNFESCSDEEKKHIKSLDKKGNYISLMLSNLEGCNGRPQSMKESSTGISREGARVKKFFKSARVDSDFFQIFNNDFLWSATNFQRDMQNNFSEVVEYLQDKLYQPKNLKQAEEIRDEIVQYISTKKVEFGHPIVLCGLAALYGNNDARKILKPKEPKKNEPNRNNRSYNAIFDFIYFTNTILLASGLNDNITISLETMDKPLKNFLKKIYPINVTHTDFIVRNTYATIQFDVTLFPSLKTDEQKKEFINWLNSHKK